jgi:hypothetical protein
VRCPSRWPARIRADSFPLRSEGDAYSVASADALGQLREAGSWQFDDDRLDVQGIALQELARALTPAQAAAMADGVRTRVAELASRDLSHAADAAVAGELVLLLDALTS